jgi:membrane protease YdiL (CAAX protease family)
MSEHNAVNSVRPNWRPILFLLFVPVSAVIFSLPLDSEIGDGYGQSKLGAGMGTLVISLLLVACVDRRPLGSFGLRLDFLAVRDCAIGIVIPIAQLGCFFCIQLAGDWVRVNGFSWNGDVLRRALWRWTGVAVFEELAVRGYLFQSLLTIGGRRYGPVLALAVTSTSFGLLHVNATPFATLALIVFGVELGVAYLVTRRLWLPIGMHFAWNLVEGQIFSSYSRWAISASGAPIPFPVSLNSAEI